MKSLEQRWELLKTRIGILTDHPDSFTEEERKKLVSELDAEIDALEKEGQEVYRSQTEPTTEERGQQKVRQAVREFRALVKKSHEDKTHPNLTMAVMAGEKRVEPQQRTTRMRTPEETRREFHKGVQAIRHIVKDVRERKLNPCAEAKYIRDTVLRNRQG